ncbi:CotH kinase family protein [Paenibacillus dokdonensis]|uniref:CotH kinase family protein n=1 Tax=Paenibacillus dokdonensis TaxID=2567944 RepID=A0ABU6GSS6_9BACL|nr:CotH kinase family protein [Paenibacillus dokdonensis]MEC0242157.1 CotH kinase family protein [Paenibacillus dokdonensis]
MKNRTIVASLVLLIVLFVTVTAILPRAGLQATHLENTYMQRVFNQSKVTNVDITMNPKDLKTILDNPLDEKMVQANVVIDGVKVDGIGMRTKGNMTLRSVAQMEDSDRYSFKLDFDYYNDDQNLYGLKKLNLNNNYSDPSQMREYLSYTLMEKMGIPTPGYSYMYVTINGKEWGLYLGVEAIEEPYLQRNFADSTGDLYKPDGTGSDLNWISDKIKDYSGLNLKSDTNSDQKAMMKLLDVINNGGNMQDVADVDEMLRYFAANTALVNLDSYQGNLKHNYYLYEKDGKFSVLPWDYNMAFGGYGVGGGGGGGGMPEGMPGQNGQNNNAQDDKPAGKENAQNQAAAGGNQADAKAGQNRQNAANGQAAGQGNQKRGGGMGGGMGGDMAANFLSENNINFSITTPVSGTSLDERPLLKALLSKDEYKEKFNKYLKEIADEYFTEDNMLSMTTSISSLISSYVEKDPTKFYTLDQLKASVSGDKSLVKFATERAESITKQLTGELVVEADTSSGMGFGGGQMPDMQGGQNQDQGNAQNNANAPNQNGGQNKGNNNGQNANNGQPQAMPDGQNPGNMQGGGMQPPDDQGWQQGQGRGNRGGGGFPGGGFPGMGGNNAQTAVGKYTTQDVIIAAIFLVLLIAALIFALTFKRRRVPRSKTSGEEPSLMNGKEIDQ